MRQRLTYEISASTTGGDWEPVMHSTDMFTRGPEEVARGLLEGWIIENPHLLVGGERIVLGDESEEEAPARIEATVRVTVYDAEEGESSESPLAVGYLGHDRRDYTGGIPRE